MSTPIDTAPTNNASTDSMSLDSAATDVAVLQRQLSECRAELHALQHEQAVIAHGISHDLRAPLRAIDNFSALIAGNASLDDSARSQLARVRAACARMGGLIDALLELSQVNRGELKSEAVDLGLLAEWVGAELQEADPGRAATLEVAGHLHVLGDERLLKLLVGQLIDNAWKFSRERDSVCIAVTGERAGERVHIGVRDAGCGFDMRYAPKLFEPFQRLHGLQQGGGNGIGLAIAQRIVERHGGRLRVESEPGVGSIFHFDLPAADAAA
jgi:signal transduction histidine kinase